MGLTSLLGRVFCSDARRPVPCCRRAVVGLLWSLGEPWRAGVLEGPRSRTSEPCQLPSRGCEGGLSRSPSAAGFPRGTPSCPLFKVPYSASERKKLGLFLGGSSLSRQKLSSVCLLPSLSLRDETVCSLSEGRTLPKRLGSGSRVPAQTLFTLPAFLNLLSWNKAPILPGTVWGRGCFLTERLWQILVPQVLAPSAPGRGWEWKESRGCWMPLPCGRVSRQEAACSQQGVPELSWPSGGSLFNAFLKYCSKISMLPKRAHAAACLVVVGRPGCKSEMLLCGRCCCKLISRSLPAERGVRSSFSDAQTAGLDLPLSLKLSKLLVRTRRIVPMFPAKATVAHRHERCVPPCRSAWVDLKPMAEMFYTECELGLSGHWTGEGLSHGDTCPHWWCSCPRETGKGPGGTGSQAGSGLSRSFRRGRRALTSRPPEG